MAATTHTHVRIAPRPRSDRGGVIGERSPRDTVRPEQRDWPTDPQVWNWAESATLSGYGPCPFGFL
ncbi:hypothetical protein ACFYR1_05600 [Streptomyces canus]|uniref:hypothetical protein n=1 Tax=Streptomyces canus TaxID=58343 RepID=UPI00369E05D5